MLKSHSPLIQCCTAAKLIVLWNRKSTIGWDREWGGGGGGGVVRISAHTLFFGDVLFLWSRDVSCDMARLVPLGSWKNEN